MLHQHTKATRCLQEKPTNAMRRTVHISLHLGLCICMPVRRVELYAICITCICVYTYNRLTAIVCIRIQNSSKLCIQKCVDRGRNVCTSIHLCLFTGAKTNVHDEPVRAESVASSYGGRKPLRFVQWYTRFANVLEEENLLAFP